MKKVLKFYFTCPVCRQGEVESFKAKIGWYGRCLKCGAVAFTRERTGVSKLLCPCGERVEGKTKKGKDFINYHCFVHGFSIFTYPRPTKPSPDEEKARVLSEMQRNIERLAQSIAERNTQLQLNLLRQQREQLEQFVSLFKSFK